MKRISIFKRMLILVLVFILSINSFAAIVADNDGATFITKAEFDSLKNNFQAQIDNYNTSIDSKIEGAIASYLDGIKVASQIELPILFDNYKSNWHYKLRSGASASSTIMTGNIDLSKKYILNNYNLYDISDSVWESQSPTWTSSLAAYSQTSAARNSGMAAATGTYDQGIDAATRNSYVLSAKVQWSYQNYYTSSMGLDKTKYNWGTSSMLITYKRFVLNMINGITCYDQIPHTAFIASGYWSGVSGKNNIWPGGGYYPGLWSGHLGGAASVYNNYTFNKCIGINWCYFGVRTSEPYAELEQGQVAVQQYHLADANPWLIPTFDHTPISVIAIGDKDQKFVSTKPTISFGNESRNGFSAPGTSTQFGANGMDVSWMYLIGGKTVTGSQYTTAAQRKAYLTTTTGLLDWMYIDHTGLSWCCHTNWDKYLDKSTIDTNVTTTNYVDADLLRCDGINHKATYGLLLATNTQADGPVTIKLTPSTACTVRVWASPNGTTAWSSIPTDKKKSQSTTSTAITLKINTAKDDYIWVAVGGLASGTNCTLDIDSIILVVEE